MHQLCLARVEPTLFSARAVLMAQTGSLVPTVNVHFLGIDFRWLLYVDRSKVLFCRCSMFYVHRCTHMVVGSCCRLMLNAETPAVQSALAPPTPMNNQWHPWRGRTGSGDWSAAGELAPPILSTTNNSCKEMMTRWRPMAWNWTPLS